VRAISASEILAEPGATVVIDFVHQVKSETIDAILVIEEPPIIDQELANVLVPVGKRETAGHTLVGKV
jgi:hypothetical protein